MTRRVLGLEAYRSAAALGIYLNMPSMEVQTGRLLADALAQGMAPPASTPFPR